MGRSGRTDLLRDVSRRLYPGLVGIFGARQPKRIDEAAHWAAEQVRLQPVELRLGKYPENPYLFLFDQWTSRSLRWSSEEALDQLVRSEDCVVIPIPLVHTRYGAHYLYDRRVYVAGYLTPEQLREAPRTIPRSSFLPIVQIEVENSDPKRGTVTTHACATPQQVGEPSKFIPATEGRVRKPLPRDVKMFVWQRDGGRCVQCGSNERLEFDHIIPWADGGSDTARNLQLLCETCNRRKGRNF